MPTGAGAVICFICACIIHRGRQNVPNHSPLQNFRCFENIVLSGLGRVNLIAGKNNVGKTAFLEAVFLHSGPTNPELPLSLSMFRGIERVPADPEDMWG